MGTTVNNAALTIERGGLQLPEYFRLCHSPCKLIFRHDLGRTAPTAGV